MCPGNVLGWICRHPELVCFIQVGFGWGDWWRSGGGCVCRCYFQLVSAYIVFSASGFLTREQLPNGYERYRSCLDTVNCPAVWQMTLCFQTLPTWSHICGVVVASSSVDSLASVVVDCDMCRYEDRGSGLYRILILCFPEWRYKADYWCRLLEISVARSGIGHLRWCRVHVQVIANGHVVAVVVGSGRS